MNLRTLYDRNLDTHVDILGCHWQTFFLFNVHSVKNVVVVVLLVVLVVVLVVVAIVAVAVVVVERTQRHNNGHDTVHKLVRRRLYFSTHCD
jgi:hypothetical protein